MTIPEQVQLAAVTGCFSASTGRIVEAQLILGSRCKRKGLVDLGVFATIQFQFCRSFLGEQTGCGILLNLYPTHSGGPSIDRLEQPPITVVQKAMRLEGTVCYQIAAEIRRGDKTKVVDEPATGITGTGCREAECGQFRVGQKIEVPVLLSPPVTAEQDGRLVPQLHFHIIGIGSGDFDSRAIPVPGAESHWKRHRAPA